MEKQKMTEIILACKFCRKNFPSEFLKEKGGQAKDRIKWSKDIEYKGNTSVYCECPFCKRKTVIGTLILEEPKGRPIKFFV